MKLCSIAASFQRGSEEDGPDAEFVVTAQDAESAVELFEAKFGDANPYKQWAIVSEADVPVDGPAVLGELGTMWMKWVKP